MQHKIRLFPAVVARRRNSGAGELWEICQNIARLIQETREKISVFLRKTLTQSRKRNRPVNKIRRSGRCVAEITL